MSLLDLVMYAALLVVCAAAWARGQRPERLAATILFAMFVVNVVPGWRALATGEPIAVYSASATLAVDIVALAGFIAVAVSSKPSWTLFAAAFQLIATLISFVRLTDESLSPLAYFTSQNTLWWLTLAALAFGVWNASSARRRAAALSPSPEGGVRTRA